MWDILIRNVTAVTLKGGAGVIKNADIGVLDGKIAFVGASTSENHAKRVIDGAGKAALPGFVNSHTHAAMAIMRGYADDYVLQDWLEKMVFPAESRMDERCIAIGTQLALAEMIRSGTIAICDMYSKIPAVARAAFDAGIYANISNGALSFDRGGYDFKAENSTLEMLEMLDQWHGADGGRIILDVSIHAEYTSFDRVWRANAEFAREHALGMHVHVSETAHEHEQCKARYGLTPARVLDNAGVFGTRAVAAHCVYAEPDDMDLLRERGVSVAHNPVSNLKLASGVAPVKQMLSRGVNIALGTDGVCSNNSHDMFEEIKLAALLQKGVTLDPTTVPALCALKMATSSGAKALGREREIGALAEGMDASLILVDLDAPHLTPVHDIVSTLVYSARGADVCMSMVKGKVLFEDGVFTTIDIERVNRELKDYVMPRVFGA